MAAGQGFKTFTTGEVLTAGDVNGYLMQGVLVFASAAARDAAITSPQEGQFAYTKDTNGLWYYDGAAWVASGATGDIEGVTAGIGISGGGTSGTVTVTNSMATTIDAKGDLIAGTADNTFSRLAVGTTGSTLVADSAANTGLNYIPTLFAGKNALINGNMNIWQRGTSSSGNAYICDRWYSALVSGTGTFAQESTVVPTGSTYSMKFTASASAQPALYQAIETANAIKYVGQTVTVSGVVAASTSTGFTIDVQHSASTDNSVTGTWTSITATSGGTATATSTTFVAISGVYAIPSTAKSLRVRVFTTSTIANGVVVYIDNIQLEQGSTVTSFQTATGTIQGELAACQRYYWRNAQNTGRYANGYVKTTNTADFTMAFPVQMRITPTALEQNGTAGDYLIAYQNTATACTSVPTFTNATVWAGTVNFTVSAVLTAGDGCNAGPTGANALLGWSAEL